MKQYGLIGKKLGHSFSKRYFDTKFANIEGKYCYNLFELNTIESIYNIIYNNNLCGFNVTIPYKEVIIKHLSNITEEAAKVGAVNVVKVFRTPSTDKITLKGYNTDVHGFEKSLTPLLKVHHSDALIFGTGGASKAVGYVLDKLNIKYKFVSRTKQTPNTLNYTDITPEILSQHYLLINASPIGMYPNTNNSPINDFSSLTPKHLCYDLVYNPEESLFLEKSAQQGAITKNGLEMLYLQAEKSWEIWNNPNL